MWSISRVVVTYCSFTQDRNITLTRLYLLRQHIFLRVKTSDASTLLFLVNLRSCSTSSVFSHHVRILFEWSNPNGYSSTRLLSLNEIQEDGQIEELFPDDRTWPEDVGYDSFSSFPELLDSEVGCRFTFWVLRCLSSLGSWFLTWAPWPWESQFWESQNSAKESDCQG